jgi:putative endonuclease
MERGGCVYILTNKFNNVYYIGVTSQLFERIADHKNKLYPESFTARYNCNKLVWFEAFLTIDEAIQKEKQMKKWKRQWKIDLIEKMNPDWLDLYNEDI